MQRTIAILLLLAATTFGAEVNDLPRRDLAGGMPMRMADHPFAVSVGNDGGPNRQFCGGSLIRKRWVLTASHCLDGATAGQVYVQNKIDRAVQVLQIHRHPMYRPRGSSHDVALLELAEPVPDSVVVPLVPQSSGRFLESGLPATILGFGAAATMFLDDCPQGVSGSFDRSNILCTSGEWSSNPEDPRLRIEQGDSGGALVLGSRGAYLQIGVTTHSWDSYSIFIRLSAYRDWIDRTVRDQTTPYSPQRVVVDLPYGGQQVTLYSTEEGGWTRDGRPIYSGEIVRIDRRNFILLLENGVWTADWSTRSFRLADSCYKIRIARGADGWRPAYTNRLSSEFYLRGPNGSHFWRARLFAGTWITQAGNFSAQWNALRQAGSSDAMTWQDMLPYLDPQDPACSP